MQKKWCLIGSKNECCGVISSALKFSRIQNQTGAGTFEVCKKEVAIVMESILH